MQPSLWLALIVANSASAATDEVPWLEVLKALVGLGGFFGVVVTLIYTHSAARKADRLRRQEEEDRRKDALRVFKTALRASLTNLRKMVDDEIRHLDDPEQNSTWVPLLDYFEPYRANLDKIGQVSDDEVGPLASVYCEYQEYAGYIARRSGIEAGKPVIGVFAEFKGKEYHYRKGEIRGYLNKLVEPIDKAMAALLKDK